MGAGATLVALLGGLVFAACQQAPLPTAREGRELYATNGCASCHGASGHGDGPVGATLDPRPRDFRDPAAFKSGYDVNAIAKTIATGLFQDQVASVSRDGVVHHQGMPRFDHLSELERQSLALYVITLRGESR